MFVYVCYVSMHVCQHVCLYVLLCSDDLLWVHETYVETAMFGESALQVQLRCQNLAIGLKEGGALGPGRC